MENSAPSDALLTVPPRIYEFGTITRVLSIAELGEYKLYLSGKDGNQADFTLEIPIIVGAPWYDGIPQLWPVFLLIAAAILYRIFRKL